MPEEHYFENLLFAYAKYDDEGYDKVKQNDSNIEYFDQDVKQSIEICATYVIDCCDWDKEKLSKFLGY